MGKRKAVDALPQPPSAVITGVTMGLVTTKRLRQIAVAEIPCQPSRKHVVSLNSVLDPRLGVTSAMVRCATCGQAGDTCQGHVGICKLPFPVLNPLFLSVMAKILNCLCFRCSALLIPADHYKLVRARGYHNHRKSINELQSVALKSRVCLPHSHSHGHVGHMLDHEDAEAVGYCGAVQPAYWIRHEMVLIRPVFDTGGRDDLVPEVTAEDVARMLEFASKDAGSAMGFHVDRAPLSSLVMRDQIVPPVLIRPSRSSHSECDLSMRLREIGIAVKDFSSKFSNNLSMILGEDGEPRELLTEPAYLKPSHATHTRNRKPAVPLCLAEMFNVTRAVSGFVDARLVTAYDHSFGRSRSSVRDRYCGPATKSSRMRGSIFGKRGDGSGRAVAAPDTYIDVDEVGVPKMICRIFTLPIHVTPFNYQTLLRAVQNGAHVYPGANFVQRKNTKYKLPGFLPGGLRLGDIVHRHLIRGDPVLINRQPTLHLYSLMAFKVRPMKTLTAKIHLSVTPPLNADFDGDEINILLLMSFLARAEAKVLMSVAANMWKGGKLLVSMVQHICLGFYLMTSPLCGNFTYDTYTDMLYKGNNDSIMHECLDWIQKKFGSRATISGLQLAQAMIPTIPSSLQFANKSQINHYFGLAIKDGWSNEHAIRRMGFIVRVVQDWLISQGATMGIDDCTIPDLPPQKQNKLEQLRSLMNMAILKKQNTIRSDEIRVLEDEIQNISDELRAIPGNFGFAHLQQRHLTNQHISWLIKIILSKSKGKTTHIIQNTACVGQQMDATSNRPTRLCGHQSQDLAAAEGLVSSSFLDGLNAIEFYHHLTASRLGLVGTAVTTSEGGYLYRCVAKCLEDWRIAFDGSVRDGNNRILLDRFGFATARSVINRIRFLELTESEIRAQYHVSPQDDDFDEDVCSDEQDEIALIMFVRDTILTSTYVHRCAYLPLDLQRLEEVLHKHKDSCHTSSCSPYVSNRTIRNCVKKVMQNLQHNAFAAIPVRALFLDYLSCRNLRDIGVCTETDLSFILRHVVRHITNGTVQVGTAIGLIGAQEFTEPLTQGQLDCFHFSGERSVMTGGIPRIKEVLNLVPAISTPCMYIFLEPGHHIDPVTLVQVRLCDIVLGWNDGDHLGTVSPDEDESVMVITIALNRELMVKHHISPRKVAQHLKTFAIIVECGETTVLTFSTMSDDQWWVTIKIGKIGLMRSLQASKSKRDRVPQLLSNTKHGVLLFFSHTLIYNTSLIQGTENILDFYIKSMQVNVVRGGRLCKEKRQVIVTRGSNLRAVCALPGVDIRLTTTNNVIEVFDLFGIDATTRAIEQELTQITAGKSGTVTRQYVRIIAQTMTQTGEPLALTFSGLSNQHGSKLKLASFERSLDGFIGGAVLGQCDSLNGISEAIMMGKLPSVGTGGPFELKSIKTADGAGLQPRVQSQVQQSTVQHRKQQPRIPQIPKNISCALQGDTTVITPVVVRDRAAIMRRLCAHWVPANVDEPTIVSSTLPVSSAVLVNRKRKPVATKKKQKKNQKKKKNMQKQKQKQKPKPKPKNKAQKKQVIDNLPSRKVDVSNPGFGKFTCDVAPNCGLAISGSPFHTKNRSSSSAYCIGKTFLSMSPR